MKELRFVLMGLLLVAVVLGCCAPAGSTTKTYKKRRNCVGLKTKLLSLALLSVLVVGCASFAFKPDTTNAQSSIIMVKDRESHYVHNEKIDFSAGLDFYNNDSMGLYLYFKNNSQEQIRVDPAAINCQGFKKDGSEESVAIQDPDKYIERMHAINAAAILFSGGTAGAIFAASRSDVPSLDKYLLKKQDMLPGQQLECLVLISRVFVNKSDGRTNERLEVEYQKYKVSLALAGQQYELYFQREEIKKQ
jgi:hypothetical protein